MNGECHVEFVRPRPTSSSAQSSLLLQTQVGSLATRAKYCIATPAPHEPSQLSLYCAIQWLTTDARRSWCACLPCRYTVCGLLSSLLLVSVSVYYTVVLPCCQPMPVQSPRTSVFSTGLSKRRSSTSLLCAAPLPLMTSCTYTEISLLSESVRSSAHRSQFLVSVLAR